jgi:hypothetical protein
MTLHSLKHDSLDADITRIKAAADRAVVRWLSPLIQAAKQTTNSLARAGTWSALLHLLLLYFFSSFFLGYACNGLAREPACAKSYVGSLQFGIPSNRWNFTNIVSSLKPVWMTHL